MDHERFDEEWRAFREAREERLRDPHGWLAVTGLHWLGEQPRRFDDVPGEWSVGPDGVVVDLAEGESLDLGGTPAAGPPAGRVVLGPVDEVGLRVGFGAAVAEVASRSGSVLLRPRHPDSERRLAYHGTPVYPPSEQWVVPARFEPYPSVREVTTATVVEGLETAHEAAGELVFELHGAPRRLVAFAGGDPDGGLWVLFTDATSGVTTYAACRQLATPAPAPDGRLELDFNRALNMPCAYTPFATCPLPPPGNRLDLPVEAGERDPGLVEAVTGSPAPAPAG